MKNRYQVSHLTLTDRAQLQQVVRVNNPPPRFTMSFKYKTGAASMSANFKFQYRRISYAQQPSCGNAMPSSFDVDHPVYTDGVNYLVTAKNVGVSGSTSWVQSQTYSAPEDPSHPFGDGLDVFLVAVNLAPSAGDLYVDNFFGSMAN